MPAAESRLVDRDRTPLPVVTAIHPATTAGRTSAAVVVARLAANGVLVKTEALRPGEPEAVRIGIISRRTGVGDVEAVVALLEAAVS